MFLITNGDLNCKTEAIICERADELDHYIDQFVKNTNTNRDQIVVNPIGEPVDNIDGDHIFGEEMDGDHASALASAGFGTDEDYGHFGGDFYD